MVDQESSLSILSGETNEDSITAITKVFAWLPPKWLEKAVIALLTPILLWMVIFLLTGKEGLPGGQIFALLIIIFAGIGAGYIFEQMNLPPLLGMLAVGIIIQNVPRVNFGTVLENNVSYPLRQMALAVILIRAGLGLNPAVLKRMKRVVLRLVFIPCLVEASVIAVSSYFILDLPWAWAFVLGFTITAVSPAIVIPGMLNLRERGYGVEKGIPTIVIAAAGAVDVLAISAFGVSLGFAISQGNSLTMSILQEPIQISLGIGFGILWGLLLGVVFAKSGNGNKEATVFRLLFTFIGGCLPLFGFHYFRFGSGGFGCLTSTLVAAIIWRRKRVLRDNDDLIWAFKKLWFIFQPLLFGLIGREINVRKLELNVLELGLLCLFIGLIFRILTSFCVVARAGLTLKERAFIAVAWTPKATAQAALGPVAYDLARSLSPGPVRDLAEKMGLEVLTIAVLSILLTAPIGSIAIKVGGPRLLTKDPMSGNETLASNSTRADETSTLQQEEVEQEELSLSQDENDCDTTPRGKVVQEIVIKIISIQNDPKYDGGGVTK